jgi:hypothetical protein
MNISGNLCLFLTELNVENGLLDILKIKGLQ